MGVDTVVPTFYIVVSTNTLPKHTPCSNGPNSAVKPCALDVSHNALQLLSGGFLFQCVEGDWYMVGGERSSLSVCWRWLVYGRRGEKFSFSVLKATGIWSAGRDTSHLQHTERESHHSAVAEPYELHPRHLVWQHSLARYCMSVFGKSVRTNNDVEGWHNRVNTHAQKCNLQFYLLIELMYKKHPRYHFNWRWYLKENYVVDNESRPRWYSGKSYSYGTTTPTTRLQLVIYWRSVAAFILPVCRVFSDIVCIWMNRCI
jgi:hypothetical protein